MLLSCQENSVKNIVAGICCFSSIFRVVTVIKYFDLQFSRQLNGSDLRIFEWNPCTPFKTDNGCDTMVSDEEESIHIYTRIVSFDWKRSSVCDWSPEKDCCL